MMNSNSASALNSPFAAAARRRPRSPVRLTLLWPDYGTLDVVLDFLWQQGLNPTSLEGELESPFKDDEPVGAEEPALVKELRESMFNRPAPRPRQPRRARRKIS